MPLILMTVAKKHKVMVFLYFLNKLFTVSNSVDDISSPKGTIFVLVCDNLSKRRAGQFFLMEAIITSIIHEFIDLPNHQMIS